MGNALRALKSIDGVLKISFGPTFTHERAQGFTHVLVVEFQDKECLHNYAVHPEHVDTVKAHVVPNIEAGGVLAVDYEM
ncbi:hypothetical protein HK104_005633 [Borealophlyctis nickersoniae]|nr:hypothetical protein HK104_005633 [Borealophlyctis nickersoniae]